MNFNGWIASESGEFGARLVTEAGVGVGATLAEMEAAYGGDLTWSPEPDEITGGWHFSIGMGDDVRGLHGEFSGDPATSGTTVSSIHGGFGFDVC